VTNLQRAARSAVLKGYLEFQREIGGSLDASEIEAPLKNLPFLYQLWYTLQLIRTALNEAQKRGRSGTPSLKGQIASPFPLFPLALESLLILLEALLGVFVFGTDADH